MNTMFEGQSWPNNSLKAEGQQLFTSYSHANDREGHTIGSQVEGRREKCVADTIEDQDTNADEQ